VTRFKICICSIVSMSTVRLLHFLSNFQWDHFGSELIGLAAEAKMSINVYNKINPPTVSVPNYFISGCGSIPAT